MTVLHGYIDDSGDGNTFILSCLQAETGMWTWVELDWLAMLEKINTRLREQGRQELSRYHACDCNEYHGEFKGWILDEQIELTQAMLRIFKKHAFHINAYSVDLKQLQEEIPETRPNPKGFAYVFLLYFLMLEIGDFTLRTHKDAIVGLTHDHCDCDAALLESFQPDD